jgi:hypothetical protein
MFHADLTIDQSAYQNVHRDEMKKKIDEVELRERKRAGADAVGIRYPAMNQLIEEK